MEPFNPNLRKFRFLINTPCQFTMLCIRRLKISIFSCVNFEFIDSSKNNVTKHLFIFDDSIEENCYSKAFVDSASAGRHRGLCTVYIKHNLFHQRKLGRDVEIQNTHIVLFKCPHDVIQVCTLSAQLGLGSELVDCIETQYLFPTICW